MNIESIIKIFKTDDGSLPDINFEYQDQDSVPKAYEYIQSLSTSIVSTKAYYWSCYQNCEIPIEFGENPAYKVVDGEAEPFHIVFGGIKSPTGNKIPDLGVFVLSENHIAIDYRMGEEWNIKAIIGLFEIMLVLTSISDNVTLSHEGNYFETDNQLITAFNFWKLNRKTCMH